jgi:hypothetical protein
VVSQRFRLERPAPVALDAESLPAEQPGGVRGGYGKPPCSA